MSACFGHAIRSRFSLLLLAAAMLAACQPEAETAAPEVRPVRTVTVVKRENGETVAFTGRIEAENETRLAFRIGGRMIERAANVGDRLEPDQVVAKLDPQDQLNSLRAAQAGVAAAQAQFAESQSEFERQRFLLERNVNSRAQFERAEQATETARAQLETGKAQLRLAEDQVARTELRADTAGIVTTTSAEPGEVVRPGQAILRVASHSGHSGD
jgi:RND family efflux transporter MFP subunit